MKTIEDLNQELIESKNKGDSVLVEELINRGADVHVKGSYGETPLHRASLYGDTKNVLTLISKGADIHVKDNDAETPLHCASSNGSTEAALALISEGADINAKNNDGQTVLHRASRNGHTETVLVLISKSADIHAKDKYGWKPLYLASRNGNTEAALVLISYGADASQIHENLSELKGITMHQAAAQGGFTSRTIELLSDFASSLPQDSPQALAALAKQHEKHETAAAIQSFNASQAIESMLKNASPGTSISRV